MSVGVRAGRHVHSINQHNMKRSPNISMLLACSACLLLAAGCSKDSGPTAPTSVAGKYRSTIFIRPTPTDGADSSHLRGDYVEMSLDEDGMFTGVMRTSYVINGATAIDTLLTSGTYTMQADTVRFSDPKNGAPLLMMPFKRVGSDLHGKIQAIGPFEVYLKRK